MRPTQGCFAFCYLTLSQFGFVVAKYLNCAHTNTHTYVRAHARTDPDAVHSTRNEDKRLEFHVWHQTSSSCWPATPSYFCVIFSLILLLIPSHCLFSSWNQRKQKQLENLSLFSSAQETKTNLMVKLKFFLFFFKSFFQIQGTMSINIPIYLSVCVSVSTPRYSVRTSRHISYWTVCSTPLPTAYISIVCTLTLLREASVLVERATAKSKPVINNEQNKT